MHQVYSFSSFIFKGVGKVLAHFMTEETENKGYVSLKWQSWEWNSSQHESENMKVAKLQVSDECIKYLWRNIFMKAWENYTLKITVEYNLKTSKKDFSKSPEFLVK